MATKVHDILQDQHNITDRQMILIREALAIEDNEPVPDAILSQYALVQILNRRTGAYHEDDACLVVLAIASLAFNPQHWQVANRRAVEKDDPGRESLGGAVSHGKRAE